MDLVDALDARGVVCVVGAGGKKTTLYTLAGMHNRAVVTATVRIPIFDPHVARVVVTTDPAAALGSATDGDWPLGLVPERERDDRYLGYDPTEIATIAEAADADAVLVKADGARTRWLKAPDDREPQLPAVADTVVPIASARVVGKPLTDEHVHRPERVAAVTDRALGEPISADDVATVLASSDGGLKDVPPGATVVPLVNMVDDADLEAVGREIAEGVLARADGGRADDSQTDIARVVLARMIDDDPVVAVVE